MSSLRYVPIIRKIKDIEVGDSNKTKIESDGKIGFLGETPQAQKAHIVDATGTVEDVTAKFNTLLSYLEDYGLVAKA